MLKNLNPFLRTVIGIVIIAFVVVLCNFLPLPSPFPSIILFCGVVCALLLVIRLFMGAGPPAE